MPTIGLSGVGCVNPARQYGFIKPSTLWYTLRTLLALQAYHFLSFYVYRAPSRLFILRADFLLDKDCMQFPTSQRPWRQPVQPAESRRQAIALCASLCMSFLPINIKLLIEVSFCLFRHISFALLTITPGFIANHVQSNEAAHSREDLPLWILLTAFNYKPWRVTARELSWTPNLSRGYAWHNVVC